MNCPICKIETGSNVMPCGSKLCDKCYENILRSTEANLKEAERRNEYERVN